MTVPSGEVKNFQVHSRYLLLKITLTELRDHLNIYRVIIKSREQFYEKCMAAYSEELTDLHQYFTGANFKNRWWLFMP